MHRIVALLATYLIGSCARPDNVYRWPTSSVLSAGAQPEFAIKAVVDKQKPASLIAEDGSVCRTSVQRFTRTAVGKWIACSWQLPASDT